METAYVVNLMSGCIHPHPSCFRSNNMSRWGFAPLPLRLVGWLLVAAIIAAIFIHFFTNFTKAPRTLAPYICSEFSNTESSPPDIF